MQIYFEKLDKYGKHLGLHRARVMKLSVEDAQSCLALEGGMKKEIKTATALFEKVSLFYGQDEHLKQGIRNPVYGVAMMLHLA